MHFRHLLALGLIVSMGAAADSRSVIKNTESSSSLGKASTQLLTHDEKTLAKQWMLEESDWLKYKEVMRGPRGVWSPGLDPLTALGVSETDPEERKRYAELWQKMETRRAELEIAFEIERMRAGKKINGDQQAVNNVAWVQEWEKKYNSVRRQVAVFMDASCKKDCEVMFQEVKSSVGDRARLDVFFTGSPSSEAIGQWAAFMKLDPGEVKARKVTLNYDEGKSTGMDVDTGSLPQVRVIDMDTGAISTTFK